MMDTVDLLRAIGIILVVCIVLLAILIYRSVIDMIDTVLSDEVEEYAQKKDHGDTHQEFLSRLNDDEEEEVSEAYGRVRALAAEAGQLREKVAKSSVVPPDPDCESELEELDETVEDEVYS